MTRPHRLSTLQLFITQRYSIVAFRCAICNSGGHLKAQAEVVVVGMPIGWQHKQPVHHRATLLVSAVSIATNLSFLCSSRTPRPSVGDLLYLAAVVAFHHP